MQAASIWAKFLSESDRIERINIKPYKYDKAIQRIADQKSGDFYIDNHCLALKFVQENSTSLPSIHDILELHRILMKDQTHIYPGEFRTRGVQVGGHICPNPVSVPYMVDNWAHKLKDDYNDELRVHADYETIHPFFDGNGRSGRLLWLWTWLYNKKPLEKTFLKQYFSGNSFQERQLKYYKYLSEYRYLNLFN